MQSGEHRLQCNGVGLFRLLVVAMFHDPSEAKSETTRVARRPLHAVEGDFNHLLGPNTDAVSLSVRCQFQEPLGLPGEYLVRRPFESLATCAPERFRNCPLERLWERSLN